MRRLVPAAIVVLALVVVGLLWRRNQDRPEAPANAGSTGTPVRSAVATQSPTLPPGGSDKDSGEPFSPDDFPIVAPLNQPGSTIARDLETLAQVFEAWRTNFPREGNPVGENAEITAALTGDNRLQLALVPRRHPAINPAGELFDRWGTPFRFHQLSGERMEIRSAGPDRTFATADDAVWNP